MKSMTMIKLQFMRVVLIHIRGCHKNDRLYHDCNGLIKIINDKMEEI